MTNWTIRWGICVLGIVALVGSAAWAQDATSDDTIDEAKLETWQGILSRAELMLADAPAEKLPTAYRWLCVAQAWQAIGDDEAAASAAEQAAACLNARDEAKPRGGATMSESRSYSPYQVARDTAFLLADAGDSDGALEMLTVAEKWLVSSNKALTIGVARVNILARGGQTDVLLEKLADGANAESIVAVAAGYRAAGDRDGAIQVLNAIDAGLGPIPADDVTAQAIDAISRDVIRLERIRLGDADNLPELTIKEEFYLLLGQVDWGETELAEATLETLLTRIADLPPVEEPSDADDSRFATQYDMISYLAYVMARMDKTDEAKALLEGSDFGSAAASQQLYRLMALHALGETEFVATYLADIVAAMDDGSQSSGDASALMQLQQAWGLYVGVPHETREILASLNPRAHQFDLAGGVHVVAMYYQQGMTAEVDALLPEDVSSYGTLASKVITLLVDVGDAEAASLLLADIGPDNDDSPGHGEGQWAWFVAHGVSPLGMPELLEWLDELEGKAYEQAIEGALKGMTRQPRGFARERMMFDVDETIDYMIQRKLSRLGGLRRL